MFGSFLIGLLTFSALEPFIISFIYMRNIPLFLDLVLTKKQKDKLISYIKNNY